MPSVLGLSRSNIETMLKAWVKGQYGVTEATHEITFKWTDFEHEIVILSKRK